MSNYELEYLSVNLKYDLSEFTELYINNMKRGVHDYTEMFRVYLLGEYVMLVLQYDLDNYDMNILNATEMVNVLTHINVILNKNYNYDFEKRQSAF